MVSLSLNHSRIAHARGDEPALSESPDYMMGVFPTPVGMNRSRHGTGRRAHSVPHACGDELGKPWLGALDQAGSRSAITAAAVGRPASRRAGRSRRSYGAVRGSH